MLVVCFFLQLLGSKMKCFLCFLPLLLSFRNSKFNLVHFVLCFGGCCFRSGHFVFLFLLNIGVMFLYAGLHVVTILGRTEKSIMCDLCFSFSFVQCRLRLFLRR